MSATGSLPDPVAHASKAFSLAFNSCTSAAYRGFANALVFSHTRFLYG